MGVYRLTAVVLLAVALAVCYGQETEDITPEPQDAGQGPSDGGGAPRGTWNEIKKRLSDMWNYAKQRLKEIRDNMGGSWGGVKNSVSAAVERLSKAWDEFRKSTPAADSPGDSTEGSSSSSQ